MLNLTQVRQQIKSGDTSRCIASNATAAGQNIAYRQLKALGWVCQNQEIHPTDRVPMFRLGSAAIRRDKQHPGAWIVEAAGGIFQMDGNLADITADIQQMEAEAAAEIEALPTPTPTQQAAADLTAEYPHLAGRIASALALVEQGVTDFPQYQTSATTGNGGKISRDCNCPDAYHRGFRTEWGIACKHTIAQEIADRVKRNWARTVNQEIVERNDRRQVFNPADFRPAADPLNLHRGHYTPTGAYVTHRM